MKAQTLIATTAIAGLLGFATIAHAGPNYGKKGGYAKHGQMSEKRMQKRFERIATKLELSETQKTQLQTLNQNSRNEIKPLRDEKRAIRQELRQLDPSASDYSAKLADAANRQAELTRQLIIAKGNKRQQMSNILTTEQLAKKKELRAKRKARSEKRKHRRHHKKQQQS